jgi:hypothetical protein
MVILLMLSNAHKPNGCQRGLPSFWQLMWLRSKRLPHPICDSVTSLTNQMVIFCHNLDVPQVWHMPKLSYGNLCLPPKPARQGGALGAVSEVMFV